MDKSFVTETPDELLSNAEKDKIIISLDNICDFPPIKAIRDSFNQKYQYRIIDDKNA